MGYCKTDLSGVLNPIKTTFDEIVTIFTYIERIIMAVTVRFLRDSGRMKLFAIYPND